MDTESLRQIIREELEKVMFPCHFLISYDIHENESGLRAKLPVMVKELGGMQRNESLYCFNGGSGQMMRVVAEIERLLLDAEHPLENTAIYCIQPEGQRLLFQRIGVKGKSS